MIDHIGGLSLLLMHYYCTPCIFSFEHRTLGLLQQTPRTISIECNVQFLYTGNLRRIKQENIIANSAAASRQQFAGSHCSHYILLLLGAALSLPCLQECRIKDRSSCCCVFSLWFTSLIQCATLTFHRSGIFFSIKTDTCP